MVIYGEEDETISEIELAVGRVVNFGVITMEIREMATARIGLFDDNCHFIEWKNFSFGEVKVKSYFKD